MVVKNMLNKVVVVFCFLVSANAFALVDIQTWETSNGAKVLFVAAPELPMVDVQITFDAGAARDGDKSGVALLTNGMLPEGAGKWNANDIAERIDSIGAEMGNSSKRDMSIFTLRSLTESKLLEKASSTLATILADPTFPKDAFERERRRLLIALEQKKQSPRALTSEAFFENVYLKHPYASQPEGTIDSINALTISDLKKFYQQYFVGKNAVIAIVGALDKAGAQKLAEKLISQLPAGQHAPRLPQVDKLTDAKKVRIDFPSSQSHLLLGQPGVKRGDPDYFPLYVGNHVLGGGGLVSIISDEIREKRGLAYSSYSYFIPMRSRGPFLMGLQTRNDQVDEALDVLKETLTDFVNNGPTEEQLVAAQKNLTGGFALEVASNKKIVGYLGAIGFYNLPLDYLDTYISNVEAVTTKQVRDAFQRRIHPDKLVTVVVGGEAQ
jgi:zinc protease